ncbi:MAG: hypothetical protein JXR19_04855 [Bacteroidia bacterium]
MRCILLLKLIIFLNILVYSQSNCACCEGAYTDFNFWIGNWEVVDTNGQIVGHNTISYKEDSCVMMEEWKSSNSTGTSYSYYNRTDQSWNQVWVDNNGGNLTLKGKFEDGSMVMTMVVNDSLSHQVKWTEQENGTVTQDWNLINTKRGLSKQLFYGIYRRIE